MAARWLVLLLLTLFTATHPALAENTTAPLKVVTYNIRYANPNDGLDIWPNRVEAVTQLIGENDIAGLQEVTFGQLGDLRERLNAFDSYGVGRVDGESGGEHASIFYRRDRLEAIDKGTFWLSESPDRVGGKGWDAALPRTCTWMVLRDRTTGRRLWIANTHFDHRGSVARTESGKLIRRIAGEKAGSLPVIVMGDFNCEPDSEPYHALTVGASERTAGPDDPNELVDSRLVSKASAQGPESTWNGFREIVPGRTIDHIFAGGPVEIVAVEVLNPKTQSGRFASDHLPVRALVRLGAATSGPSAGRDGRE